MDRSPTSSCYSPEGSFLLDGSPNEEGRLTNSCIVDEGDISSNELITQSTVFSTLEQSPILSGSLDEQVELRNSNIVLEDNISAKELITQSSPTNIPSSPEKLTLISSCSSTNKNVVPDASLQSQEDLRENEENVPINFQGNKIILNINISK